MKLVWIPLCINSWNSILISKKQFCIKIFINGKINVLFKIAKIKKKTFHKGEKNYNEA